MSRRARARDMLAEGAPSHAGFVPSSQYYPSKPTSFLSIIRLSTEHNGIVVLVGFFTASASHHSLSLSLSFSLSLFLSLSLSLSHTCTNIYGFPTALLSLSKALSSLCISHISHYLLTQMHKSC